MANGRLVDEAALDHVPAEDALESTKGKGHEGFGDPLSSQILFDDEPHHWEEEDDAYESTEEPVEILPKENALEVIELHPVVDLLVLGEELILRKHRSPLLLGNWRDGTHQWTPIDH